MFTVFDGADIQVTFDRHQSSVIVVTFSDHFRPEGQFRSGFGEQALAQEKISTIYVKSSKNHWWQTPEIFDALAIIRGVMAGYGADYAVTYGASMGGYAAIHFASAIGACRAFALSPQSDIWKSSETRWRDEAFSWPRILPDMRSVISDRVEYIIVVDPHEKLDMMQVDDVPNANLLLVEDCGHRSVPFLSEIGHLKRLMLQAVQMVPKGQMEIDLRDAVFGKKKQSSTYIAHFLTRAMRRRKHRGINGIFEKMRCGKYLDIKAIHPRDRIAFMRAACEAKNEWAVNEIFELSGGHAVADPQRASYLQTLKRNGFHELANRIEQFT